MRKPQTSAPWECTLTPRAERLEAMRAIREDGMDKPKLISMISDALIPLELAVKQKRGAGDATGGGRGKDERKNKGDDEVTGGGGSGRGMIQRSQGEGGRDRCRARVSSGASTRPPPAARTGSTPRPTPCSGSCRPWRRPPRITRASTRRDPKHLALNPISEIRNPGTRNPKP